MFVNPLRLYEGVFSKRLDPKELLDAVDEAGVHKELERQGVRIDIVVTDSTHEEERFALLPPTVKERICDLQTALINETGRVVKEMEGLKSLYPDVPVIYNTLANGYSALGDRGMSRQTALEMRRRFPDYLFGKVALAECHILAKEYGSIPEPFDGKLDIRDHFPAGTQAFHYSEVRAFHSVTGVYHAATGNLARAILSYWLLSDLKGSEAVALRVARMVVIAELGNLGLGPFQ